MSFTSNITPFHKTIELIFQNLNIDLFKDVFWYPGNMFAGSALVRCILHYFWEISLFRILFPIPPTSTSPETFIGVHICWKSVQFASDLLYSKRCCKFRFVTAEYTKKSNRWQRCDNTFIYNKRRNGIDVVREKRITVWKSTNFMSIEFNQVSTKVTS